MKVCAALEVGVQSVYLAWVVAIFRQAQKFAPYFLPLPLAWGVDRKTLRES